MQAVQAESLFPQSRTTRELPGQFQFRIHTWGYHKAILKLVSSFANNLRRDATTLGSIVVPLHPSKLRATHTDYAQTIQCVDFCSTCVKDRYLLTFKPSLGTSSVLYAQTTLTYFIKRILSRLPLFYSQEVHEDPAITLYQCLLYRRQRTNAHWPCFSRAHVVGGQGKGRRRQVNYTRDMVCMHAVGTACARLDSPNPSSLREAGRKCCRCAKCPCLGSCQPTASRIAKDIRTRKPALPFNQVCSRDVEKFSVDLQGQIYTIFISIEIPARELSYRARLQHCNDLRVDDKGVLLR